MIRLGSISTSLPLLLLLVFISTLYASSQYQSAFTKPPLRREIMTLQSMYQLPTHSNRLMRMEIPAINQASVEHQTFSLPLVPGIAYRPTADRQTQLFAMKNQLLRQTQHNSTLEPTAYPVPDVSDHASVLALGEMSYNAYTELGKDGQWYDLGAKWRIVSLPFFIIIIIKVVTRSLIVSLIELNVWLGIRWTSRPRLWQYRSFTPYH
jgi:putative lipase involved disintegration of autophagic bodies